MELFAVSQTCRSRSHLLFSHSAASAWNVLRTNLPISLTHSWNPGALSYPSTFAWRFLLILIWIKVNPTSEAFLLAHPPHGMGSLHRYALTINLHHSTRDMLKHFFYFHIHLLLGLSKHCRFFICRTWPVVRTK